MKYILMYEYIRGYLLRLENFEICRINSLIIPSLFFHILLFALVFCYMDISLIGQKYLRTFEIICVDFLGMRVQLPEVGIYKRKQESKKTRT